MNVTLYSVIYDTIICFPAGGRNDIASDIACDNACLGDTSFGPCSALHCIFLKMWHPLVFR
jgi:hypothetical protein